MSKGLFGGVTTLFISAGIIFVIVMIGVVTFGVAAELEKGKQLASLSDTNNFDPNSLPATGAGFPGKLSGQPLACDGIIFRAADNGVRYVRESGGGLYYAAEVNSLFGIYKLQFGALVKAENSSLDTHTYRKLKHALYHCEGTFIRSGLHLVLNSA